MFFSFLFLFAAVLTTPIENLVINGRFETDQTELPTGWLNPERAIIGETMFFDQNGGPNSMPCLRFTNAGKPDKYTFRQIGFKLVPGARYRMSAQVRTKNFSGRGSVFVISSGWTAEAGFSGFPANSPWTLYSKEISAPKNSNPNTYQVLFYVADFTGEISFADLKLEPLDDAAKKGSKPPAGAECEKLPRFFPWTPRLSRIDADDRKVSFMFAGNIPEGSALADYAVLLKVPDGEVSAPLQAGVNTFVLPGSLSRGRLSYEVRRRSSAAVLLSGSYPFRTVGKAVVDANGHRRLNNLVTELLSAPLEEKLSFCSSRVGWVHISLDVPNGDAPEVKLDGEVVIPFKASRREAFREVGIGSHVLTVSRVVNGRVVVRQTPEILNYPSCADSPVDTNPSYKWDFFSRFVMPNCTTHCGGFIPERHWDEFKMSGGVFLDNIVTRGLKSQAFRDKLLACKSLSRVRCDGVALDEHLFGDPETFGDFIGGMRLFAAKYNGGRKIYTWTVCKPYLINFDREMFATAVHASPDGARVLTEIYCRGRATEAEAQRHIDDYLIDTGRKFKEIRKGVGFYPDAMQDLGVILGNFSQIPVISVWHHPQMDMKYFLDMQFNALANNPTFNGLGSVGVWGSYYCDEEMYRWTFMLARHYCIEGRKDMLSKRYGLSYLPGHVENGDFEDGLTGWQSKGYVEVQKLSGFAEGVERRWGGSSSGNSFAVLGCRNGEAASLEQTLKGFTPGRKYSLDVVCFDVNDAKTRRHRPARHPLSVALGEGACKDDRQSWVFIDRRKKEGVKGWGVRCNRHHIVFTARTEEIKLTLRTLGAADAGEVGVNWIGVWPYVEAEK